MDFESIQTYEGNLPYIFISYAHANSPAVMQVVADLTDRGYRVWYDGGIEVGSEWQEDIAGHLASAGLMIAFLSNAYMRSDNCRKEMHYALSKKIPVINIFLEETQLTPGMEMQVGNLFALMKYTMSEEAFSEKLFAAPQLTDGLADGGHPLPARLKKQKPSRPIPVDLTVEAKKKKKKKIRRFVGLGLLLAMLIAIAVLGLTGWSTGLIPRLLNRRKQPELIPVSPDTVIVWTESALERAAREYCGISEGDVTVADLTGLRTLWLSGDEWSFELPDSEAELLQSRGTAGSLQSLSDLQFFPDLSVLVLEHQALSSLETLPVCGIEELTVLHCKITGLSGVGKLPLLRELTVAECPLRDLGDLEYCLQLRTLCLPGESIRSFSAVRPLTKLAEVRISGSSLHTLRPVFRQSSLTDICLTDCDLRGRFFYSFDRERAIVSLSLEDCKLNSTKNLDDFTGLTTLTLIHSGATLDWSALKSLPSLKTVTADETMLNQLHAVLEGSNDTEVVRAS